MAQPVWVMPLVCFFAFRGLRCLLAREGVLDGDGEGGGVEVCSMRRRMAALWRSLWATAQAPCGGAVFGGEDVGVAERFLDAGVDGSAVVARICTAEPVIETVAPDGVPKGVHAGGDRGRGVGAWW